MEPNEPLFNFPVETSTQRSLLGASTWAKFLGILGFVFMGLMLIFFAIAGAGIMTMFETVLPAGMTAVTGLVIVLLVIVCAVVGVLSYLLLRGANLVKKGIQANDQAAFNAGLSSYRTYFMVYGIIAVISLIFNLFALF